jgi:ABC-type Fe3+/spermidine/putrescine transport system ATPase subunit
MRTELKLLQQRLHVTVLFVTHDQLEALSLSDTIAVMNQGRVEQVGGPRALYEAPTSPFVRDLVGQSEQDQVRLVDECPTQRQALLLTAAQLSGWPLLETRQADQVEHFNDARVDDRTPNVLEA